MKTSHALSGVIASYAGVADVPIGATSAGFEDTNLPTQYGEATAPTVVGTEYSRLVFAATVSELPADYTVMAPPEMVERARISEVIGSAHSVTLLSDEGWPSAGSTGSRSAEMDPDGDFVAQMVALTPSPDFSPPVDEALLQDAEVHAEQLGVSIPEALAYLELQDSIGEFAGLAATAADDIYGGLAIQYDPYRVTIFSLDSQTSTFHELARDEGYGPVADLMVIQPAEYSLAGLEAASSHFLDTAPDVPFEIGIDIFANTIELITETDADGDEIRAALTGQEQLLPPAAFTVIDDGDLTEPGKAIWAGMILMNGIKKECTAGFTVRSRFSGRRGITTAGHCANSVKYDDVRLTFVWQAYSGNHDVQWHETPGLVDRPRATDGSDDHATPGYRSITRTKGRGGQTVGTLVCKWGYATKKTCGEIRKKNKSLSHVDGSRDTFIEVRGPEGKTACTNGDSGGPWYSGNTAYGVHSSHRKNNRRYCYYTASNYVQSYEISILLA